VELNKKAKGDLAELKVAADLRARGYRIAIPYGEDWDFDLILCRDDGALERVQVKYVRSDGCVIEVQCCSHSLTNGKVKFTKRYTAAMIDWLAVWDAGLDRCFYVPASELCTGMNHLSLRLSPTRNNQVRGIRLAERYTSI
jgi:PD-(D/E)XK endonuclease